MHVALEYAVPHLGLAGELMFGGLGKVVEMFIRHSTRPILVCAPLYKPFFAEDGEAGWLAGWRTYRMRPAVPPRPTLSRLCCVAAVPRLALQAA